jgi:hypothetical protein
MKRFTYIIIVLSFIGCTNENYDRTKQTRAK